SDEPVSLAWESGDAWYVAASYRLGEVPTPEIRTSLTADDTPQFGEFWTDDVVWTYQVVESDYKPSSNDELYEYAVKHDGSIAELAVIRAWVDGQLNDDEEMLEADPVVYLVFRQQRNRLAGVVSFVNVDGERTEHAYSSKELGKSWSSLSQANLSKAPSYLAPFGFKNESNEMRLENGSYMNTSANEDGSVDVTFEDELGGGLVASRYNDGDPWPEWTVSDNLDARMMTEDEVDSLRRGRPWLAEEPPEDYDYKAALSASVNLDEAMVLDPDTINGGWEGATPTGYEPWSGSWWPQSTGGLVFGYDYRDTYSERIKADIDPLKKELDKLSSDLRDMDDGEEKDAKVEEYRAKQSDLVNKLVKFYNAIRDDLDGGKIKVENGKIAHADDGWEYDLDELSPMDKFALHTYLKGGTSSNNPFFLQAWELLNHYSPAGGSWWGHCNGWAAAAILVDEPTESVFATVDGHTFEYTTADLKGLLSESHYSTYSKFYGQRYNDEEQDIADLHPQAFHKLVSFYHRDMQVPLVFDTSASDQVWNFPSYATTVTVEETTVGGGVAKVNVNTADAAELDTLPGIGPAYAERIIDFRQTNGPFQSVDDMVGVRGIGNTTLNKLRDLVTVDPESNERTFAVVANTYFATDGVDETWVDPNGSPASKGFVKTYKYTLTTDADGMVTGGEWEDKTQHPDFAWMPYNNPMVEYSSGSENGYLSYQFFVDNIVDLRRE
ncbi:MAG: hypothetical protein HN348_11470, partial [Proteobacteria bacterium]|nr:hypothetical protein [Pseudomonadota bacterium]